MSPSVDYLLLVEPFLTADLWFPPTEGTLTTIQTTTRNSPT